MHCSSPCTQLEQCLYGESGSGSVYRLLQRESLSSCPLSLRKGSIIAGHVTAQEYQTIVTLLEEISPIESRGRIRAVTIVALKVAIKLAHALGRCPRTTAFLRALRTPLPRLWEAQLEQEQLAADMEMNPLLDDEVKELEEEDVHMALELVSSHVPFAADEQDDEKASTWRLPSIPAALQKELDELVAFRTEPINRARDGVRQPRSLNP